MTLHALQLAVREGEEGVAKQLAALEAGLYAVYDPRQEVPGRAKADSQQCAPLTHGERVSGQSLSLSLSVCLSLSLSLSLLHGQSGRL